MELSSLVFTLALLAGPGDVPAHLVNARTQTHAATGGLKTTFESLARTSGPAWIAYAVPAQGEHEMCCYRSIDGIGKSAAGCRLEDEGAYTMNVGNLELGGGPEFFVLFRVEGGRVDRIRSLSRGCGIDAGGLPFHWITGVRAAESLQLLASMVDTGIASSSKKKKGKGGMDEPALAAIAMHADPGADAILESLAAPSQRLGVRKQAVFWMGNARGRRGYETVRRLAKEDADPDLREHAIFALSQSDVPEALDVMIDVARHDKDPEVRAQGVFWLSQKAGKKAAEAITRAVEEDPETEVKKKAVFALSQLPKDEGVPLLIGLARTHANPVVRKQAMFWLGQSEDPRALALFAEILGR